MTDERPEPLLEWLFSLSGPSLKWDIETAQELHRLLGHPDRAFTTAHIAGTNGKGSVAAMLQAMACVAGMRPGMFTSPHLVRPEERIRVGAEDISPADFRALILDLRDRAADALARGFLPRHPSFFEMVAAAALLHFRAESVDLGIIETGLGGRLDATNVIHPAVTIITTIGLDHVKSLGGDILSIAGEKAGILKPGVPLVLGFVEDGPGAVLEARARALGAPLHAARRQLEIRHLDDGRFDVRTPERTYAGLRCSLAGRHQAENAALALRAAELLRGRGVPIGPEAAVAGLAETRWPGRLETIDVGGRFLLDAAHNEHGIGVLTAHLRQRDEREGRSRPRVLLLGLTEGRKPEQIFPLLAPLVDRVVLAEPRTRKAIDAGRILERIGRTDLPVEAPGSVRDAVARARQLAGETGEVLVTGSLYLVGDVRQVLLDLPRTLHRANERLPPIRPLAPRGGP